MNDSINPIEHLRNLRNGESIIEYGQAPIVSVASPPPVGYGLGIFVLVAFFTLVAYLALGRGFGLSLDRAFSFGMIAAFIYLLLPVLYFVIWLFRRIKNPEASFVNKLSASQKWFTTLALSFVITTGIDITTLKIFNWWHVTHRYFHYTAHQIIWGNSPIGAFGVLQFLGVWGAVSFFMWFVLLFTFGDQMCEKPTAQTKAKRPVSKKRPKPRKTDSEPLFKLWIGESTGWLSNLYHGAGIAPEQQVTLALTDASQNILILGAIGSGKTTRAMHPLLVQFLDQNCGGLIFDIKGDFQSAVLTIAEALNRQVIIIGVNHSKMNLLAGLTPEVASSFLKSIFTLNAHHHTDAFWLDTAVELCRNTLGILSFVPKHYSLNGLYGYLFDLEFRVEIDESVTKLKNKLNAKEKRLLNSYWHYHEKIFDKFEDKVKSGVNATVAQVLSPFNHPDLVDAFCTEDKNAVVMEDVLNGAIYLVEMPLSTWGLGGKVVYTLIKLRFFNVMQKRLTQSDWNQERPVFFMCDEFQEIVSANKDGISDLNFWDKSRSSKTIGVISAQAVSSFYAAIGDRDTANALLQNFRQKICFKTEDTTTLNYFHSLADKVEVARKTYSSGMGNTKQNNSFHSSKSDSQTESITHVDKPVIDAQLFRSLHPAQALALLSIGGKSMDDVINTFTIFI